MSFNLTVAVCSPAQSSIMKDDDLSLFCPPHIQLKKCRPVIKGLLERGQSIFRRLAGSASMAEDAGSFAIEKRIKG